MSAPAHDPTNDRLVHLEEKVALSEDLLEELNRVVARQQLQIEALARELMRYRRQVEELVERSAATTPAGTTDERPPHY